MNWYAANAGRNYPVDDQATTLSDAGLPLPDSILTDAYLRFPQSAGQWAYLSGVTVTQTLVTVVISATNELASEVGSSLPQTFAPLAAISLVQPVAIGRPVAITPLLEGVGGWVVFGHGVLQPWFGRFTTPDQSFLAPRAAASYRPVSVTGLRKSDRAQLITGIANLVAGTDITLEATTRIIDGLEREAIVISLKTDDGREATKNRLLRYTGPCGARPESGNCAAPGLQTINGVSPDCDGNIQIVFSGNCIRDYLKTDGHGILLDYCFGLEDACADRPRFPDEHGRLPDEYTDACGSLDIPDEPGSSLSISIGSSLSSAVSSVSCPEVLPYTENFDDGTATNWTPVFGSWDVVIDGSLVSEVGSEVGASLTFDSSLSSWPVSSLSSASETCSSLSSADVSSISSLESSSYSSLGFASSSSLVSLSSCESASSSDAFTGSLSSSSSSLSSVTEISSLSSSSSFTDCGVSLSSWSIEVGSSSLSSFSSCSSGDGL